ncbi:hypothetical protein F9K75_06105 [Brucella intermedia]|nr:hypothetical protein F9K75_06105 [Brucella intermedia]
MFGEDLRYWKNHSQDVSTPVQLLEMLALFLRIILRKTASHFCWKCSLFCWKCWMKRSETAVGATFVSTFNLSIC